MKLAFISPGTLPIPPVDGGAVENLIDIYLKKNEKSKTHQVTVYSVFSTSAFVKTKEYKHVRFEYIDKKRLLFKIKMVVLYFLNQIFKTKGNAFIHSVVNSFKDKEFDTVIIENQPSYIEIVRKHYKGKVVLHLHNNYISNGLLTKEICEKYDAIITVSEYLKKEVEKLGTSVPIFVTQNGLSNDQANSSNEELEEKLKKKLEIEEDDLIILFTGRLTNSKGVHLLIDAFKKFSSEKRVKLIITGAAKFNNSKKNKYIKKLENMAKDDNRIIFTGYVDYENIGFLYRIADIGVVPSISPEAFGLSALEHMIYGNPVIVSNVGALPEVVDEKSSIILDIESKKFIEELYQSLSLLCVDEKLRFQMGLAAIDRASLFEASIYYQNLNSVIQNVGDNNE